MVLEDSHPVGNVWLCEHDWFIRPYGSTWERLYRLLTWKSLLFLLCFILAFPGAGFLIYVSASYPDGPEVFQGFEYRCGEQFDRTKCADVPVYIEDESGLDYPQWVEFVDDNGLLIFGVIVSSIVTIIQGNALWNLWIGMGGVGLFGRRNHKHLCPECDSPRRDNEPNCPGFVYYECSECWEQAQKSGHAQQGGRNLQRLHDTRATNIWAARIGNSGITRLYRYNWNTTDNHFRYGKLARDQVWGTSKYVRWCAIVVLLIVWLLFFAGEVR